MIPVVQDSVSASQQKHLEEKLGEIASRIRSQGKKRRLLAEVLDSVKDKYELPLDDRGNIIEPRLVYDVEDFPLEDVTVSGVDGGVLNKPMHGLDLILVRAVATIFHYEDGSLQNADYHPSEMPAPQLVNIHEPLNSRELDVLVGLKRQITEINRAREVVETEDIDAILLDGSVVPQYTNHTSGERTEKLYERLIDSYKKLYRRCLDSEVLLLGAVEDSRSTRLGKIFRKNIIPDLVESSSLDDEEAKCLEENEDIILTSRDTAFLDHILDPGDRTFTFSYSEAPSSLLENLGDWRKKIYAFYIKPVPYDRPVRIEFLANREETLSTVQEAASLVESLSAGHDGCALPSVLIEADARAALAEEEISILRDNIADRLEPSTMLDLRRERRPF